jgi:hypothetical protein
MPHEAARNIPWFPKLNHDFGVLRGIDMRKIRTELGGLGAKAGVRNTVEKKITD